tara:strand:+ start:683 stop:892 length:210 start_codon:yes stop_codon:yes gene_type:complete
MYGLKEQIKKSSFTCDMCKSNFFHNYSYVFYTYGILPKTPSEKLIICQKCALREGKYKTMKQFKEAFNA